MRLACDLGGCYLCKLQAKLQLKLFYTPCFLFNPSVGQFFLSAAHPNRRVPPLPHWVSRMWPAESRAAALLPTCGSSAQAYLSDVPHCEQDRQGSRYLR